MAAVAGRDAEAQVREPLPWRPEALATVVPDPRVDALVDELDADDQAARARASAALLEPAVPEEQVWLRLSRGGLSAEAHRRLLAVGRSRIVDAPRGALGIQMAGRFASPDGVVITALIPNMPARLVLKPGDRIVLLDGKPIQVDQQLSSIVQTKRPGERIKVVVMRGASTIRARPTVSSRAWASWPSAPRAPERCSQTWASGIAGSSRAREAASRRSYDSDPRSRTSVPTRGSAAAASMRPWWTRAASASPSRWPMRSRNRCVRCGRSGSRASRSTSMRTRTS
ncbi:MAG: PDZ domain-containing protein, partial [Phycisphaerales bacterium]